MCLVIPWSLRLVCPSRGSRVAFVWRSVLSVALGLTLSLVSVAVPDPLWIRGAYDDGDRDLLILGVHPSNPFSDHDHEVTIAQAARPDLDHGNDLTSPRNGLRGITPTHS